VLGQQVPHRAYRSIRNDIDFAFSLAFSSLDFNGATAWTNFERFTFGLQAVCFSQVLTWKSNSSHVQRARFHQWCNLPMGKADRTASTAVRKWKASSYKPPRTKKAQNKLPQAHSEVCRVSYEVWSFAKAKRFRKIAEPPDADYRICLPLVGSLLH
jgi:hypothetical protein